MGAAIVFTEMISADGLIKKNPKTLDYLYYRPEERPIGFQLFGSDPYIVAKAVEHVAPYQPDFIDLNFGCPVKKVVKRGAGAALLNDIDKLRTITAEVVRISSVPVWAKIRKGWDDRHINAIEVGKILEQCGVQAITIHPRTQVQLYRGQSDWQMITKLKQSVSIPVIGNGDIWTARDAKRMLEETGCDLVMIGRGCLGYPWIFKESNYLLEMDIILQAPLAQERLRVILEHLEDMVALKGPIHGLHEMRKHLGWYTKGLPKSTQIRAELFKLKERHDIEALLTTYFGEIEGYETTEYQIPIKRSLKNVWHRMFDS